MGSKKFVDPLTLVNVTTTQRDALTGTATGDIIYNSTVGGSQLLIGGTWQSDLLAAGLAGGQSLAGGTGSSDVLLLRGSTSSIFGGTLSINSPINGFASDQTITASIGSAFKIANTYTLNFATSHFGGGSGSVPAVFEVSPTLLVQQNAAVTVFGAFRSAATTKNVAGSGVTSLGALAPFKSTQFVTAVTDTVALAATADFFSRFFLSTLTSGTLNLANDYVNYEAGITISDSGVNVSGTYAAFGFLGPSVTGGTLANVTGLRVGAHSAGSTTSYGVDIGPLTGAGANIGVRIAAPSSGGTSNIGLQNKGTTELGSSGQLTVDTTGNLATTGTLTATGVVDGSNTWDTVNTVTGSDVTTTGQALTLVTGLSTAFVAGTYQFEATLRCTTSADAAGIEFGCNISANLAASGLNAICVGTTTAVAATQVTINASNTATAAFLTAASVLGTVRISGTVVMSGAGTFSIRFLKVTSGTATVKVGSILYTKKVA